MRRGCTLRVLRLGALMFDIILIVCLLVSAIANTITLVLRIRRGR